MLRKKSFFYICLYVLPLFTSLFAPLWPALLLHSPSFFTSFFTEPSFWWIVFPIINYILNSVILFSIKKGSKVDQYLIETPYFILFLIPMGTMLIVSLALAVIGAAIIWLLFTIISEIAGET